MKHKLLLTAILLLIIQTVNVFAQDSLWVREYQFNVYSGLDLRNSSDQGIAANRILHDVFRKNVKTKMPDKLGEVSYGLFSFATTYMTMLWSHEFGHSMRANQVGGEFRIHNASLPIPYTTMHLPNDISYSNEALSVTGGFEVNYLSVRKLQGEFIANNGAYNEDLAFSFANRMLYPIYTSLIIPIDPEDPEVWINTAGDPVHCVLPVFKNYSNNNVFESDGSVNPELVSFYKQSALFGFFFNMLDPQFFAEMGATFGNTEKVRRPKFLIGDHDNGWTYGTMFSG